METIKNGLGAAKKELGAFKKFISRGNVIDMAVGVIIGGAFGKIVTSLVNDIVMPLIGLALGKLDFASLSIKIGESEIKYGNFIQTVVDFLIVALCIFIVIEIFEKFKKKEQEKPEEPPAIVKSDEAILLEEIRDLLKQNSTDK
ncbi:large-conductance mechanosensitive channel protein MscL [Treponema bryantii]|uniref:large-conductance mechanosensitive channel protein MscL n=1 Tax=Treponema bryantii TaxID=163 RepID=UPI002B2C3476|nr:large-conductance mechanosensitive channel [Treponema bryantii]